MTRSRQIAGGDVMVYGPATSVIPARRLTTPRSPNVGTGRPVRASSATSRPSVVPNRMRASDSPLPFCPSQYAMPRCGPDTRFRSPAATGSYTQRSTPVSASSAIRRDEGVEKYSVPPTTSGVVSNAVGRRASRAVAESGRGSSSPV
jgi:hypothetical protein